MSRRPGAAKAKLAPDGDRLLPMRDVKALTSWSRTSIYRLVQEGKFPKPVKLGEQRIAFRESEVRAYVASRRPRDSICGRHEDAAQPQA